MPSQYIIMTSLTGWHPGEQSIQHKLGYSESIAQGWQWIEGEMPEQHRVFHTTRLPFIPITTLDSEGRPWASIAAGPTGELGFVDSPHYTKLRMHVRVVHGDPLEENLKLFEKGKSQMLIAGLGIEFSTRRRNKFAGHVTSVDKQGDRVAIELEVNQAIGYVVTYSLADLRWLTVLQKLSKVHQLQGFHLSS